MQPFVLGNLTPGNAEASIDLERIMREGLLIQGGSGSGKSWALRRIIEQTAGQVQIIVIDPEGEFASLREKHDFLLAAPVGGDVPLGVNSAELFARRLLELRTSAICDLFDLPVHQRHRWVRLFVQALMNVPKDLWHDVLIVIDEIHLFAPEKGSGDSEASGAIVDLSTRGRKRGYGRVAATQRMAGLLKGVLAELKNVLAGHTFYADDQERAAKSLGITRAGLQEFRKQLGMLPPGIFFGLGRAIATEEVLIKVGPVFTTHPTAGGSKHMAAPPAPVKIRKLLAELADLPAEAEAEATSLADLRRQVAELKAKLAAAPIPKALPAPPPIEKRIEVIPRELAPALNAINTELMEAKLLETRLRQSLAPLWKLIQSPDAMLVQPAPRPKATAQRLTITAAKSTSTIAPPSYAKEKRIPVSYGAPPPKDGASRILHAAAQHGGVTREQLTVLLGYRRSSRDTYIQKLRAAGALNVAGDLLVITPVGLESIGGSYTPLPTGSALRDHWMGELTGGERALFEILISSYPDAVARDTLSEMTPYKRSSRDTYLQKLGSRMLVTFDRGSVRASEELFR